MRWPKRDTSNLQGWRIHDARHRQDSLADYRAPQLDGKSLIAHEYSAHGRGRETGWESALARLMKSGWPKVMAILHGVPGYDGMTVVTSPEPRGSVKTTLIRFQIGGNCCSGGIAGPQPCGASESFFDGAVSHGARRETLFVVEGTELAPGLVRWKAWLLMIPTVYGLVNFILIVFANLTPRLLQLPVALPIVLVIPMNS